MGGAATNPDFAIPGAREYFAFSSLIGPPLISRKVLERIISRSLRLSTTNHQLQTVHFLPKIQRFPFCRIKTNSMDIANFHEREGAVYYRPTGE